MQVRQPPEMSDRQELCGVWVAQVELTCRQIVDAVDKGTAIGPTCYFLRGGGKIPTVHVVRKGNNKISPVGD